jgi:ABC-type nitrate/sulfonate/bicarbonate transport system substrate-binding protein
MENQTTPSVCHEHPNVRIALKYLLIMLLCGLLSPFCAPAQTNANQTVAIAVVPGEISALVYLAMEQGYFQDEGIQVRLEEFEVDYEAVNALLQGKVQFATATEFVLTRKILMGDNVKIMSSLCRADVYRIVVRRKDGLFEPRDLVNKRIGIRYASIAEFYLSRFFLLNDIASEDVHVQEMPLNMAGQALASDSIDAVFLMSGDIPRLFEFLPQKELFVLPAQQGIDMYWLLAFHPGQATEPGMKESVLRALIRAEEFMEQQRLQAHAVLQNTLGLQEVDEQLYSFRVALEQALVLTMEDEARWLLKKQLDPQGKIPNFLEFIHFDTLKSIKPKAVNIIH